MKRCRYHKAVSVVVFLLMLLSMFPQFGSADVPVAASIELTPDAVTLKPGETVKLTAVVKDQNGNVMDNQDVTWSSSSEGVVTVNGTGLVTAVGPGTAGITAVCGADPDLAAFCSVSVFSEEEGDAVAASEDSAAENDAAASGGESVASESSSTGEESAADEVSAPEENTLTGEGNDAVDGSAVGGVDESASTSFSESEPENEVGADGSLRVLQENGEQVVSSIELSCSTLKMKPGTSSQITAVVKDQNGQVMEDQAVTWSSSDESVATVNEEGLVTTAGVGTADITAACSGVTAVCSVTVDEPRPDKLQLNFATVTMVAGSTRTLQAAVYDQFGEAVSNPGVVWGSSSQDVATVSNGVVTAVSEGPAEITATVAGTEIKAVCAVNVVADFQTKLVIMTGTDGFVAPMVEAYHNLTEKRDPPYLFGLKVFSPKDLETADGIAKVKQGFLSADVILLEMIGANRDAAIRSMFSECYEEKWKEEGQPQILVQRSGEKNKDGSWATQGFIVEIVKNLDVQVNKDDEVWSRVNTYLLNSGVGNWERLLLYLATTFGDGDVVTDESLEPIVFSGAFAYHPAADISSALYEGVEAGDGAGIFFNPDDYYAWYESRPSYKPGAPWVGILTYDTMFKNADQELYVETLKAVERKGLNAILLYPPTATRTSDVRRFFFRDLDGDGVKEPAIDVFICAMGFNFDRTSVDNAVKLFQEMDVPVLTPIYSSDLTKWYDDPAGAMKEVYWQVAMPELEGRIEPVFMGGTVVLGVDEATGAVITKKIALPDRMERLAGRACAWAKLRTTPNSKKKIAIIYYNYEGGKDGITASYLNVPRSLTEILKAMKARGYTLDEDGILSENGQISEDKVFEAMFSKGRNIGGWAPGELQKFAEQDGIIKIDLDTYLEWYNQLPEDVRQKVESEWGPPPGQMMVYNGEIIIPGVISGNVFFGPQPMRGWGEDVSKILHSPDLPPPHQYLAFYFWLQHGFKADAVIHLGTHGTAEWLPGKAVGLSSKCWPDIVQGDMPNIYPYIVNNPGEATQAKRRGCAVIIDHLTAALVNTDLYGNLLELHNLAHQYDEAVRNNQPEEDIERIKTKIMMILKDEGVAGQMGLDPENTPFEELLDAAHEYLDALQTEVTPLGLHTFGVPPQGELFDKMVQAIINYDPENRQGMESEIRGNLARTTEEIDNLLRALEGRFIEPGVGKDPVRDPSVMPTGRNIKSFDPRTVPDKYAWEIGKKMADELLATYYQEHGSYPESIGVILWAIETMRTEGQSIAMAMRLLGIEPVWDASGRVKSYKITSVEEMGRPRIDVVVTMSGLFRDTFSVVSELLDKAIRELALLNEDAGSNYVKKHYEEIKEHLESAGKSESEAAFLAASRVFSEPPGTYGVGLSNMMGATESWEKSEDLVDVYLSRMGYIYTSQMSDGTYVYGGEAKDLFVSVLKNVQAVVQVRDSVYGALDNDDVAQYLGGLVLAARWASGADVDAYIANTRLGLNGAKIQTFEQFVAQELHSRLLNPKFIEEMLKEGYAGAATIAKWIGNTFYVDATTGAVGDWAWHGIAEGYVFDENVRSQLNPYALQSLIAYTMEAARKGFWQASEDDLRQLSDVYIQTAVDYGVVCCHHTCKNIVFNEWVAQFTTLDSDVLKKFVQQFKEATMRDVNIPVSDSENNSNNDSNKESTTNKRDNNSKPSTLQDQEILVATPPQEQPAPGPADNVTSEIIPQTAPQNPAGAGREAALPNPAARAASAAGSLASAGAQAGPSAEVRSADAAPQRQESSAGQEAAPKQGGIAKAYEITPVQEGRQASGVTVWAIAGAVGGTLILLLGFLLRR